MKQDFQSIKWVWVDLDDTLIDFEGNSRIALHILYKELGLGRFYATPRLWVDAYMANNHALWARYNRAEITKEFLRLERMRAVIAPYWSGSEESLTDFSWEMDRIYLDRLAEQTGVVSGAREMLEWLRSQGYRVGVLSNGFKQVQHRKIESAGLSGLIDLVVLSDDIGVNKPDIRLFEYAMERAGDKDPSRHMLIGDNPDTDMAGAVGAGWGAVWFNPDGACAAVGAPRFEEIRELDRVKEMLAGCKMVQE